MIIKLVQMGKEIYGTAKFQGYPWEQNRRKMRHIKIDELNNCIQRMQINK